jgi:hypothetical protein
MASIGGGIDPRPSEFTLRIGFGKSGMTDLIRPDLLTWRGDRRSAAVDQITTIGEVIDIAVSESAMALAPLALDSPRL